MSFTYRRKIVALDNYSQIFEGCSPDILDEIRSAVLDNTPIAQFIDPCKEDSYLLGQIRMALREGIPADYLDARLTGKTIYNMRQAFAKGIDMSGIMWYIAPKKLKLDKEILETLSDFCMLGTDIRRVDFTQVPRDLVLTFCKGLYRGYPMWLLVDESPNLTQDVVRILMRGMELGIDIHPFLQGDWDKNVLLLLFSYSKSVDLNDILRYINSRFDSEQVKVLLDIASRGIPISRLCVKDTSGIPVYNSYQMYELGENLRCGVDIKRMFDVTLSDFEMSKIREEELAKRNKA